MSQTIVQLGSVPVNRGDWEENYAKDSATRYYKDNIVSYRGSAFIANPPDYDAVSNPLANIAIAPFTGESKELNAGWNYFVDAKTYVDQQMDVIMNGSPTEALDSLTKITAFLNSYTDEDSLYVLLENIQDQINGLKRQIGDYILKEVSEDEMEEMLDAGTAEDNVLYLVPDEG